MLKKTFDFILALIGLMLFLPVFAFIALLIKIDSKGPVMYSHERVGKDGKTFTFYKFRTMVKNAEENTGPIWAKPNDERTTGIGRYLRKTNLDELPQLYNVLKGDMSLVGPRPERPFFVEKFRKIIKGYDKRHKVKPGITGWAQVNGYVGNTSLKKRVECDIYYVDHRSFLLDLRILGITLMEFISKLVKFTLFTLLQL